MPPESSSELSVTHWLLFAAVPIFLLHLIGEDGEEDVSTKRFVADRTRDRLGSIDLEAKSPCLAVRGLGRLFFFPLLEVKQ